MHISVVIPLFNKGVHIVETIASVSAQTYPPHEIIVVDDGSTDGGYEAVVALNNPMVRTYRRDTPSPGGYAARNAGIEHATGDWIAFIDADDLWTSDHLEQLARAVQSGPPTVGCVFSRSEELRATGTKPIPYSQRHLRPRRPLAPAALLDAWLETRLCPIWTGAVMIRRDMLLQAGLFPAGRATRGGDKDLWLRVMLRTDSMFVDRVTAQFRQDAVNRVSSKTAHTMTPVIVETVNRIQQDLPSPLQARLRRLVNQEVALYARYAAGAGRRIALASVRRMSWRGGVGPILLVAGLTMVGPTLARVRRAVA